MTCISDRVYVAAFDVEPTPLIIFPFSAIQTEHLSLRYSPSMNDRMRQLEVECQALQKAEETTETPQPVMIHPNLAELYRRRVADLEQLLVDPELGSEAMDLIRSMITEIKIVPGDDAMGSTLSSPATSRASCISAARAACKTPRPLRALGVLVFLRV
jgi:hypothetical protein